MRLILAHDNADLDAIASLALARKLHPDAIPVLHGGLDGSERTAFILFKDSLGILTPEDLPDEEIESLIVVDTHHLGRLGEFAEVARKVPVLVYDHHPTEGDVPPGHYQLVGSCATLLTRRIQQEGIELTNPEATLALAGLEADTDFFQNGNTTREDFQAAAYLSQFADLRVVREITRQFFDPGALGILAELLKDPGWQDIGAFRVILKVLRPQERIPGAGLAMRLISLTGADAVFLFLQDGDRTDVVARARQRGPNVSRILQEIGGGGHKQAASARVEMSPEEALQKVLACTAWQEKPVLVCDRMTRDVRTLSDHLKVSDAIVELVRIGHNGAPVLHEGKLVGMVSRRDLDRAMRHGLQNAPVRSVMSKRVISIEPDAPLGHATELIRKHSVGRLPVVKAGHLLGILTRSDLLGEAPPKPDLTEKVLSQLQMQDWEIIETVRENAPGAAKIMLVGGAVRDALLGKHPTDLDVVVSGADVIEVAEHSGLNFKCYPQYGNATLSLPNGNHLDLIQARDEYYTFPGASPTVMKGTLEQDLARRDFTINALALQLTPEVRLLDLHDGLSDLGAGLLRVLHPLSFMEDPSRIVRGARLAVRLGFRLEERTLSTIPDALPHAASAIKRLKSELMLVFQERTPGAVFETLKGWGAEELYGFGDLTALKRADEERRRGEHVPTETLMALWLHSFPESERKQVARKWQIPKRTREVADLIQPGNFGRMNDWEFLYWCLLNPEQAREYEVLRLTPPRQVTGRELLELGMKPGSQLGQLLEHLKNLREEEKVSSFEEEMQAAKTWMQEQGML
ncbi:CBS domain-containing protein [Deinococcus cellulosilyticus]|uniref:Poly(A) polymerase n=1 Tax=Deinococcus cellulosilyticus (strain DSM 18568 / NBRC 106333 / KACC 11606 / 5516J-15) TaxID=1223518 RepID=A0A511MXF4_DEIC1|nr:CBS domain-containing protein [Deinococcus cellulosilyticus]GEM44948.1 poly(A) polymerase [Deinococcus cellulosilyticus NBRC 106333 = KACC 11606]